MHSEMQVDGVKSQPAKIRKVGRMSLAVLCIAGLLVALLPSLISQPVFHRWFVQRAMGNICGDVSIERLRLRWFSPPMIEGLRLVSRDGDPVVEIPSCWGDRSLLAWLVSDGNLGTFLVEQPEFTLVILPKGTNVERTFGRDDSIRKDKEQDMPKGGGKLPISVRTKIVDGRFVFRHERDSESWFLEGLNMTVDLDSNLPDGGTPRIHVPSGQVLDHIDLTPRICRDLLKFITPVLAESSWVDGQLSMSFDHIDLPLGDLALGDLSGELVMHSVRAGAGPVIGGILRLWKVPESLELVHDSRIQFMMRDGRVHHEGFQFQTGNIQFQTSGSIGLDESLDLLIQVKLSTAKEDEVDDDIELWRRMPFHGQALNLPITGTLHEPRVDVERFLSQEDSALPGFSRQLLGDVLRDSGFDLQQAFNLLRQRGHRRTNRSVGGANKFDSSPLLEKFRGLIRELVNEPVAEPPASDE